tara:strand:+ start:115 stop:3078 length:2964 start_codon:yes stop_codon:yes gene_type:complete
MAFKTQMRLAQISGSFGNADGKIRDDLAPEGTLGTIVATDLSGSLSVLASAVKRINGGAAFSAVTASTLKDGSGNNRIEYVDGAGIVFNQENGAAAALTLGSSTATDKLALFGGNAKFADAADIGSTTTVDLLKLNANDVQIKASKSLKVDSIGESAAAAGVTIDGVLVKDNDILFPGDVSTIGSDTTNDLLTFNANDVQVKAGKDLLVDEILESTSAAGVTIDGVLIKDNDIVIPDGSTIGSVSATTAMTIDAAGVVAFVDDIKIKDGGTIGVASTADALTLASNGDLTLKEDLVFADGKLLGSDTTKDMLTINANDITMKSGKTLIIQGDLQVNGTTATLDVTNLNVEDPFVLLGDGAQSENNNAGILFVSGSSRSNGTRPDVIFARKANDVWGLGSITSNSGSITDGTGMTHDIDLRLQALELETANDKIAIASTHFTATAANNFIVDAGADIELNADGGDIQFKDGTQLAFSIDMATVAGDAIFKDAGGTEVFRIDGSEDSLRFADDKKLEFGAGGDASFEYDEDGNNVLLYDGANMRFNGSTKLQFRNGDTFIRATSNGVAEFSATTSLTTAIDSLVLGSGGTTSAAPILKFGEAGDNGSNFVGLRAPATLGADVQLTLPSVQSAGDQVMSFNASGEATFVDLASGADSRNNNIGVTVPEALVSGTLLSTVDPTLNFQHAGITDAALDNACMVFVNGQLLLSGSDAKVGTSSADYALFTDGTKASGTITFDGTTGDVEANYVNSGTEASFEITVPTSVSSFTQVQHAGGGNVSRNSAVAANSATIEMANNVSGLNVGDLVSYVTTAGIREVRRVSSVSGLNIGVAPNTGGAIAPSSVVSIAGLKLELEFNIQDGIESTGTISGGKIQVGIKNGSSGTNLSPALGNAGAAEAVAQQVVNAITQGSHDAARNLSATLSGLAITVQPLGFFGSGLNGVATISNIQNTTNNPFAQANFAGGADSGAKSLKFGFGLEADDVVQIHIR